MERKERIVSLSLWERARVRERIKIRKINSISPLILTFSQREKGLKQKRVFSVTSVVKGLRRSKPCN
jgi:hypothetical protein